MIRSPAPRWRLILNGKAAADDDVRAAVATMRERGVDLEVRVTWEPGDIQRHVESAVAAGVTVLLAGGGDGTLSAVATALARREPSADALPALALLPLGTANDFATAAGMAVEPLPALELVQAGPAVAIDLLRIDVGGTAHWCANLASGGFGTQVTVETSEGLKKMLGGLAYLLTGMARLGRIEPIQARITGEGADGTGFEWSGGFIALGIGNGSQAGGGQVLCPDALVDDGLLDLTIVPSLEGEVGATIGTLVGEGRQAALERVAVRGQLRRVRIEAPEAFTLNLDGEPVEHARFDVECVPRRLRMHLPDDCPLLSRNALAGPGTQAAQAHEMR